MATMRWTYRKVLNRGFTPCWYKTDHGSRIAWVEKTEASGCMSALLPTIYASVCPSVSNAT